MAPKNTSDLVKTLLSFTAQKTGQQATIQMLQLVPRANLGMPISSPAADISLDATTGILQIGSTMQNTIDSYLQGADDPDAAEIMAQCVATICGTVVAGYPSLSPKLNHPVAEAELGEAAWNDAFANFSSAVLFWQSSELLKLHEINERYPHQSDLTECLAPTPHNVLVNNVIASAAYSLSVDPPTVFWDMLHHAVNGSPTASLMNLMAKVSETRGISDDSELIQTSQRLVQQVISAAAELMPYAGSLDQIASDFNGFQQQAQLAEFRRSGEVEDAIAAMRDRWTTWRELRDLNEALTVATGKSAKAELQKEIDGKQRHLDRAKDLVSDTKRWVREYFPEYVEAQQKFAGVHATIEHQIGSAWGEINRVIEGVAFAITPATQEIAPVETHDANCPQL